MTEFEKEFLMLDKYKYDDIIHFNWVIFFSTKNWWRKNQIRHWKKEFIYQWHVDKFIKLDEMIEFQLTIQSRCLQRWLIWKSKKKMNKRKMFENIVTQFNHDFFILFILSAQDDPDVCFNQQNAKVFFSRSYHQHEDWTEVAPPFHLNF